MIEKRNFYINGSWVSPKKSSDIQVINPATEKACAVISLGSKDAVSYTHLTLPTICSV